MPHEVILPALGMAQETGLIVSWHKAAGDAVVADDVLFEVETDKATMEVAAGADGFVTQIRHNAGDEVPVGTVIAVIGDSAEAADTGAPPAADPGTSGTVPGVEGNKVIMPALGMAQDTGLIVAWHKAPGDAVASTEVLFEVETDKATMDVEAGHDGFVAALYAEAGEEAPVGEVIAMISSEKPANPVQTSIRATAKPAAASAPAAVTAETAPAAPAKTAPAPAASGKAATPRPAAVGGPVLASPKARRLAREQGLDLARLAAAGVPMPYHVADLDTLRTLPAPAAGTASGAAALHLTARVPRDGFVAFRDWLSGHAEDGALWASFAAASLRAATDAGALGIRVDRPKPGWTAYFTDPDLGPLSAARGAEPSEADRPALIVRDVTLSRITGGVLGVETAPALTVAADGGDLALTLDFTPGQMDAQTAIALIDGFAARLEEPLQHLL